MKPDYLKIIFVGIPTGAIAWFVLTIPSIYIAQFFEIRDYWLHISLLFTIVVMTTYFLFCVKHPLKAGAAIINDPKYLKAEKNEYQCEFCGTKLDEMYPAKVWQNSISGGNRICCLSCYDKKIRGTYKTIIFLNLIQVCFGIILVLIFPEGDFGWFFLNLFLVSFFSILMIIPHEIGHVLVAKFLGVSVPVVIIGMGKTVFSSRFLNILWEFKNIPFGGITLARFKDCLKYRRNLCLFTIGGPFVNLVILILFILFMPLTELFTDIFENRLSFSSAFFLANLIDLFYNLLPIEVNTSIGKVPNDGLSLGPGKK